MGIHSTTIAKLEDTELCAAIIAKLNLGYNKRYIQTTYQVTRHELMQIINRNLK